MKTYARYKDSGISWIGKIPEHWNVLKIKRLFEEDDEKNEDGCYELLSFSKNKGLIYYRDNSEKEPSASDLTKYRVVHKGQLLENRMQAWHGMFICVDKEGCVSPDYSVFNHNKRTVGSVKFYEYCFRMPMWVQQFANESRGIGDGFNRLYTPQFHKTLALVPPLSEQKAIADFLDEKTSKINGLVTAKQKQIELLKEYKQSLIANAVTKGINPKVKMKDSGINWIGKVPEHWECSTLRKHLRFVSDKGHPDEQLLSVTREQGVIIRNTESKEENHNVIPSDLSDYKLVRKGQFAINKMKSWQGSYAVSSYTGIVSPAYYVCDLDFENKEFFSIAIRSKAYVPFFTMYSKGIRVDQWDLSPIGLKTIPFFIPPKEEQDTIVSFLKKKIESIDTQISSIEKQIANLNEYKQSLISDVVTGKVKV